MAEHVLIVEAGVPVSRRTKNNDLYFHDQG